MTGIALVTIVHGRHEHLVQQRAMLDRSTVSPDRHIVVAMDDPDLVTLPELAGCDVISVDRVDGHLPLAAARNAGARAALQHGTEVLIFLDVDCLPAPELVAAYGEAARLSALRMSLLSGPVTYLPPAPPGGYPLDRLTEWDNPHPARPAPPPGARVPAAQTELFWSLSFALSTAAWERIGGFDEDFVGYGGEDTDFAFRARDRGVGLTWLGSARAFHQYHPVQSPPREHLADIVRNATLFQRRWGSWPMTGWLDAFEREGLVHRDAGGAYVLDRHSAERA